MPLRLGSSLPSFSGASAWLNSSLTQEQLIGRPTLVHFWAISCYLCKNNYPTIADWRTRYSGLQIVAVHMPRQPEDTDLVKVEELAKSIGLQEPCAIDNNHKLKVAFENTEAWVPAYFLFDEQGKLKTRAAGEKGLSMLKAAVERLFEQTVSVQAS